MSNLDGEWNSSPSPPTSIQQPNDPTNPKVEVKSLTLKTNGDENGCYPLIILAILLVIFFWIRSWCNNASDEIGKRHALQVAPAVVYVTHLAAKHQLSSLVRNGKIMPDILMIKNPRPLPVKIDIQ